MLTDGALLLSSVTFFIFISSYKELNMSGETVKLFTGAEMPLVGLGTWKSKPGQVETAVKVAIDAGYRSIDGAYIYLNEKEIGEALKEKIGTVCLREELFITSKLWNTMHSPEDVRPALMKTLQDLQLDYIDLYLMHWPYSFRPGPDNVPKNPDGTVIYDYVPITETWAAMEKLVDEGLTKHIGVSNFNSKQVDEIMSVARIQPAVNQCECHPYLNQQPLIDHMAKYNIIFEAYSPLGSPARLWAKPDDPVVLNDPKLVAIAQKYNKSVGQILIRFQVERGVVVIPKSVTPERIRSNFDVFDFKLSDEDMSIIMGLNINWRVLKPYVLINDKYVEFGKDHPNYPFHVPF